MKKALYKIAGLLILMVWIFSSCNEDAFVSDENATLVFSEDTIMFDTIFTSIGSTTQNFRVINRYGKPIQISSIYLAGGDDSDFRLNIDGVPVNDTTDVIIQAMDSIFIFVEVTVNPNGSNQPMIVEDSILFSINGNEQQVNLVAYGQDFIPINNLTIDVNTTWGEAQKPYLVYGTLRIESSVVLKILEGTKIYCHENSNIEVHGAIEAVGTKNKPIVFSGDRLEELYSDVPTQWYGIILLPNEKINRFENTIINNGTIGLQIGHYDYTGVTNVDLKNVIIEHMSFAGIYAWKSKINAVNTVVADCQYYGVALLVDGEYNFNHCTVANYWGIGNRKTPSVYFSNMSPIYDSLFVGDMNQVKWTNSIIYGNISTELYYEKHEDHALNYTFDHCLIRMNDSIYNADISHYNAIIKNENPKFVDYSEYDWQLDTLSVAKDAGALDYVIQDVSDFDILNVSREKDDGPDLGAYERVENKD